MWRIGRVPYFLKEEASRRLRSCLVRLMVAMELYMVMRMSSMRGNQWTKASIKIPSQCPSLRCSQLIIVQLSDLRESFMESGLLYVAIIVFSKKIWSLQLLTGRTLNTRLKWRKRITMKICWRSQREELVRTELRTTPPTSSVSIMSTTRPPLTFTRKKTRFLQAKTGILLLPAENQITRAPSTRIKCVKMS